MWHLRLSGLLDTQSRRPKRHDAGAGHFCSSRRRVMRLFRGRMPRAPTNTAAPSTPSAAAARHIRFFRRSTRPMATRRCVRRSRSNSPLQALITLNEEIFVDCARAFGRRMLAEGGTTTEERIRWGFRGVVSRDPDDSEVNELIVLSSRQRARIAAKAVDPAEVATSKKEPPAGLPSNASVADLAVATVIARALLDLDETITKGNGFGRLTMHGLVRWGGRSAHAGASVRANRRPNVHPIDRRLEHSANSTRRLLACLEGPPHRDKRHHPRPRGWRVPHNRLRPTSQMDIGIPMPFVPTHAL